MNNKKRCGQLIQAEIFQRKKSKWPKKKKNKTLEKMLTISGHKANANQNHGKIPPC
jgi:hypothetical protein